MLRRVNLSEDYPFGPPVKQWLVKSAGALGTIFIQNDYTSWKSLRQLQPSVRLLHDRHALTDICMYLLYLSTYECIRTCVCVCTMWSAVKLERNETLPWLQTDWSRASVSQLGGFFGFFVWRTWSVFNLCWKTADVTSCQVDFNQYDDVAAKLSDLLENLSVLQRRANRLIASISRESQHGNWERWKGLLLLWGVGFLAGGL